MYAAAITLFSENNQKVICESSRETPNLGGVFELSGSTLVFLDYEEGNRITMTLPEHLKPFDPDFEAALRSQRKPVDG